MIKISLTDDEAEHIRFCLDLALGNIEYGSELYNKYSDIEASISKKIKKAKNPLTKEALEDIRRTTRKTDK